MNDDSVQKEIEANQARKRDTEDVGLDENVLVERDREGTILDDAAENIFGESDDAPDEADHEYGDNTTST